MDDVKDAFDLKLSEIVRAKHDQKADSDNKVLGLNILTQLQQKLRTDDDIKKFAHDVVSQSGAFLKLNNDQIQLHLRNNEGNLSPTNPASINKKVIMVSIPSPDQNTGLTRFADKLEDAIKNSFNQSTARTEIIIDRKSPRKDELCIMTVSYNFPMRAIDWMSPYKERYEQFLNTGNPNTDASNAILLHSEGNGAKLPSVFALSNSEIQAKLAAEQQAQPAMTGVAQPVDAQPQPQTMPGTGVIPPVSAPVLPPPPGGSIPPAPKPQISLYLNVAGQNYGPYNYETCEQLVKNGQLTPQSMVWMEGMPAWSQAGQVPALQTLFTPPPTVPGMPPLPPTGGPTPPPMM